MMKLEEWKKRVADQRSIDPPEGYMDQLEDRIWKQIEEKRPVRMRQLWWKLTASAAVIALLVYIALAVPGSTKDDAILSQLPVEHQLDYYLEHEETVPLADDQWLDELEPEELIELLAYDDANDDVFDYLYKNLKR